MDERSFRIAVIVIAHVIFLSGFFLRLRLGHRELSLAADVPWWVRYAPPLVWLPWVLALVVDALHLPLAAEVRSAGLAIALAGALFAAWGIWTLGRQYLIGPDLVAGHRLVARGPYAVVRHPTYVGAVLYHVGASLALADAFLLLLTAAVVLPWLAYRAVVEEAVLARGLGDAYRDYQGRVPAFLPWPRSSRP